MAKEEFHEERPTPFSVHSFNDSNVFSTIFVPKETSSVPRRVIGEIFLRFVEESIAAVKPDVVLTFGGYWMAPKLMEIVRRYDAKSVFLLQNFAYNDKTFFNACDLVVVPSVYSQTVYRERLNIETSVIPPLMKKDRIGFNDDERTSGQKYVLFVNPSQNKGVPLLLE